MPIITCVAICSDGAHVVANNNHIPWEKFRAAFFDHIITALAISPQPGAHVLTMCVGHGDHFHIINGQNEVFAMLTGQQPPQPRQEKAN